MKQTTLIMAFLALGYAASTTHAATTTTVTKTKETATQTNSSTQSKPTTSTTQIATPTQTNASIDCSYVIQGDASMVTPELVLKWANQAAIQSFSYDYKNMTRQFDELKDCFTTDGWKSFYSALQDSKNLQTAQQQQLTVSATENGSGKIINSNNSSTSPSWDVEVPLKVTYKNANKNLTQDLKVKIAVSVINGTQPKFGIMQIVATPEERTTSTTKTSTTQTTNKTSPSVNTNQKDDKQM